MLPVLPPMTPAQEFRIVPNVENCLTIGNSNICVNKTKKVYNFDTSDIKNRGLVFLVQARVFYELATNDFNTIADRNFIKQCVKNYNAYLKYTK